MALAIGDYDSAAIEHTLRRRQELGAGRPLRFVPRAVRGWGVPNVENDNALGVQVLGRAVESGRACQGDEGLLTTTTSTYDDDINFRPGCRHVGAAAAFTALG